MNPSYCCIIYSLVADSHTDHGILDNAFYQTKKDARKAMRENCKVMRKILKCDYNLEYFNDIRKADRCAFSADDRVSYEVKVVEIKEKKTDEAKKK